MISFTKSIVYLPINTRRYFTHYPISNKAIIGCHVCSKLLDRRKKHRLVTKHYRSSYLKLPCKFHFWVCSDICYDLAIFREL